MTVNKRVNPRNDRKKGVSRLVSIDKRKPAGENPCRRRGNLCTPVEFTRKCLASTLTMGGDYSRWYLRGEKKTKTERQR